MDAFPDNMSSIRSTMQWENALYGDFRILRKIEMKENIVVGYFSNAPLAVYELLPVCRFVSHYVDNPISVVLVCDVTIRM